MKQLIGLLIFSALCQTASAETPLQTLERFRADYPTPMSRVQAADLLNRTAWEHRSDIALLGKVDGNNCPLRDGQLISCDWLVLTATVTGLDVLFTLPNTGESKTFEFGGAQAGESMTATLAKVRAKYPAIINGKQGAAILNEAAYLHRAEGWALLGKAGGNNCPQPTTGTRISCDYLIVNRGGTWFGQDVLISAPGENEQSPANPVNDVNPQDNMTAAISDGSRTVVLPVAPGGGPVDPPVDPPTDPTVSARLAALEAANATLQASVNNLTAQLNDAKGELAAQRDVLNNFLAQLGTQGAAIEELKALQGKPIPVSCRAKVNLGGFSVPLSCSLGY